MRKLLTVNIALWLIVTSIFVLQSALAQTPPSPILCLEYVTLTPTLTTVPRQTITLTPFPTSIREVSTQFDHRVRTYTLTAPTNELFYNATNFANLQTLTPGYNANTAIAQTSQVYFAGNLIYKTLFGLNVRLTPSTSAPIMAGLVAGQMVVVVEVVKVGTDEWGKLENGYYVAILIGGKPYMVKQ